MKKLILLLLVLPFLMQAQTTIRGVVYGEFEEPLYDATVLIKKAGVHLMRTKTDFDGQFAFVCAATDSFDAASDTFDLEVTYIGYTPQRIKGIVHQTGQAITFDMTPSTELLSNFEVVGYKIPIIQMDQTSGGKTFTGAEIMRMPTKNVGSVAASVAGVSSTDGGTVTIKGSRSNATNYYVEGIRVSGNAIPTANTQPNPQPNAQPIVEQNKQNPAGLLTAAEVNDLHKWALWSDFTGAEFAEVAEATKASYTLRFCALVAVDKCPAVYQTVHLFDAANPKVPIWTAITDNTGKAELWASPFSEADDNTTYLIAVAGQIPIVAKPFTEGINHLSVAQQLKDDLLFDIVFTVDATGSMSDEIEYLKNEIENITQHIISTSPEGSIVRFGAVFYRAPGCSYLVRKFDLTTDVSAFVQFIRNQYANEGGEEVFYEAFDSSIDSMNWALGKGFKMLFLINDEPPQDDTYDKINVLTQTAAQKGIRIVSLGCSGINYHHAGNKTLEYVLRCMALATNGTYLALTDHSGIGDKHDEPITDEMIVERLGDALKRIYDQYTRNACEGNLEVPEALSISQKAKLIAAPNPTSGSTTVSFENDITEVFLCDFSGKVLEKISTEKQEKKIEIDLTAYPSGMYLITTADAKLGQAQVVLSR